MHPRFTPDTLKFLRALKRNNDREWFRVRHPTLVRTFRAVMPLVRFLNAPFAAGR